MKKILTVLIAMTCLGFLTQSVAADPSQQQICQSNGINYSVANEFAGKIYGLIQDEDAEDLSDYMTYPLRVNQDGQKSRFIRTREEFIDQFDDLFNDATLQTFKNNGEEVFCTSEGASFGNGTLWFRTRGGSKIYVVNSATSN